MPDVVARQHDGRGMTADLSSICAMAVMAKAPRPGHVKTRLQSVLSPDEAAALGAAFLLDTTSNLHAAAALAPIHPFVAYAPAGQEARFDGHIAPGTRLILADGIEGDGPGVEGFGRSLLHASRGLLALGYGAACVVNADGPTLPTAYLVHAAQRLLSPGRRALIGPAEDGGYWLLGMQQPEAGLYAGISWSTDVVAAETRARAAGLGLTLEEAGTWYDVDDRESLARLVRELGRGAQGGIEPFPAPATARAVLAISLADRLRQAA